MSDINQNESNTFDSTDDKRVENSPMRHKYRELTENEKIDMTAIKDIGEDFLKGLEKIESVKGTGREFSIARTKIEEAVMWAVKGITK